MKVETAVTWPRAKEASSHQKLGAAKVGLSLIASVALTLGLLASRTVKE